jgi:hypothetical protein
MRSRPARALPVVLACLFGAGAGQAGPSTKPSSSASSSSASASSSASNLVAAEALFQDGRKLMDAGKHADAIPKFEESLRLDHALGTLLNLAECYDKVGRTASAWSTFVAAAQEAKAKGHAAREAFAKGRAFQIEPRLVKLTVVVTTKHPGLEVRRDATLLGDGLFDQAVPVDPGSYTVTATAPGRKPWQTKVTLKEEGATTKLVVPTLAAK